jgi:VanZ family protein
MVAAAAWTVGVIVLACTPGGGSNWLMKLVGDKVLHGFAFAVGAVVWTQAISVVSKTRFLWSVMIGVLTSLAVGGLIEILQMYVPTRKADIRDFEADLIGVLVSAAILWIISALKNLRHPAV